MNEFLIFNAGNRPFAVQVTHVQQVVPAATLSAPAPALRDVEGLLNLRGQVVPVIDLASKLGIEQPALIESDFLIILGGLDEQAFAIRANSNVELCSDAERVDHGGLASECTDGFIRVKNQIISVLNPTACRPSSLQATAMRPGDRG